MGLNIRFRNLKSKFRNLKLNYPKAALLKPVTTKLASTDFA